MPEKVLVCAMAGSPYVVPGTVYGKCHRCQKEVMIAPSGQGELARDKDLTILCAICFEDDAAQNPRLIVKLADGAMEEGRAAWRARKQD